MKNIILANGKECIVDDKWFDFLNSYSWHTTTTKSSGSQHDYVVRVHWGNGKFGNKPISIKIHHVIMGRPLNAMVVDHINGNTLDNREENLRFVTRRQNKQNSYMYRNGRLLGAILCPKLMHKKWRSQIKFDGKRIQLGYFCTPEEAHGEYVKAHKKLIGEVKI